MRLVQGTMTYFFVLWSSQNIGDLPNNNICVRTRFEVVASTAGTEHFYHKPAIKQNKLR